MTNSNFMKAPYIAPDIKIISFGIYEDLTLDIGSDLDSSHDAIIDWSEI